MVRRVRTWALVALVVWILLVTWWALTPMTDSVSTGTVKNKDAVKVATRQTVECDSPISGSSKPTEPLPALRSPRAYERTPCALPHENDRLIFLVDIVFFLGAAILLAKTWKPAEPSPALEDVATA